MLKNFLVSQIYYYELQQKSYSNLMDIKILQINTHHELPLHSSSLPSLLMSLQYLHLRNLVFTQYIHSFANSILNRVELVHRSHNASTLIGTSTIYITTKP